MVTRRFLFMFALILAVLAAVAGITRARRQSPRPDTRIATNVFRIEHANPKVGEPGDETAEALNAAAQFAQARTAPGVVLPGAYSAAFAALTGCRWRRAHGPKKPTGRTTRMTRGTAIRSTRTRAEAPAS